LRTSVILRLWGAIKNKFRFNNFSATKLDARAELIMFEKSDESEKIFLIYFTLFQHSLFQTLKIPLINSSFCSPKIELKKSYNKNLLNLVEKKK
jgi:hypothetical protein